MTHPDTRRLRDPVHGLIRFRGGDPLDRIAWQLIDTAAFQRLRRIKQLGFSEYVFPGATHTRFAHCVGVYVTARKLIKIIGRELGEPVDDYRAAVSVLAALLHDVGHGPFSHAFEEFQKARKIKKKHEHWSAEIVLSDVGGIKSVLDASTFGPGLSKSIADLLIAETPIDIYSAVVSSSFDADRLDYLLRDRLMTGSGAGAIDFDWLLDNVRVADMLIGPDDDDESSHVKTFCLTSKALQAAETFLLARYHLYDQVYLHKTTRGVELLLTACLSRVADVVSKGKFSDLNLDDEHPLVSFLLENNPTVQHYLALDDFVIWGALERISNGKEKKAADLAHRILSRRLAKCLDVEKLFDMSTMDSLEISGRARQHVKHRLGIDVFIDAPKLSIYGTVYEDDERLHKRLTIALDDKVRREITRISPLIETLEKTRQLLRIYFLDPKMRDATKAFALGQ